MTRVRCTGRTAAVAAVATAAAAGLALNSSGAVAAPAATAQETQTVQTCKYPVQKLKVGIRLTLRDANDNDLKRIKVRVSNKDETGSFYRKGVKLKSLRIETHQSDGDVVAVGIYKRTTSPAYVNLNASTTGAEVDKVRTVTKFLMPNGSTASATCTVTISD
jgi:uncharacterized protein YigE (DUF2233 family)